MATVNTNPTVAFARRRARHGKTNVYLRTAKFDFSVQNLAKAATAEVLSVPAGCIILGGYVDIQTALTASGTIIPKVGGTALSAAIAKSAAVTNLPMGTNAVASSTANNVNTLYLKTADTVDLVNTSGAALVAGVVEVGVLVLDRNMQ